MLLNNLCAQNNVWRGPIIEALDCTRIEFYPVAYDGVNFDLLVLSAIWEKDGKEIYVFREEISIAGLTTEKMFYEELDLSITKAKAGYEEFLRIEQDNSMPDQPGKVDPSNASELVWIKDNRPSISGWYIVTALSNDKEPVPLVFAAWYNHYNKSWWEGPTLNVVHPVNIPVTYYMPFPKAPKEEVVV